MHTGAAYRYFSFLVPYGPSPVTGLPAASWSACSRHRDARLRPATGMRRQPREARLPACLGASPGLFPSRLRPEMVPASADPRQTPTLAIARFLGSGAPRHWPRPTSCRSSDRAISSEDPRQADRPVICTAARKSQLLLGHRRGPGADAAVGAFHELAAAEAVRSDGMPPLSKQGAVPDGRLPPAGAVQCCSSGIAVAPPSTSTLLRWEQAPARLTCHRSRDIRHNPSPHAL